MKYTKEQWNKLDENERGWLVNFYKNKNKLVRNDGWLPDDSGECPICGNPTLGGGVCLDCLNHAFELEKKMGRMR